MSERRDGAAPTPPEDTTERFGTLNRTTSDGRLSQVRIGISRHGGGEFLSLRQWVEGSDGVWYPCKNSGINVRRNEVIKALDAIRKVAVAMGLLPDDDGPSTWRHYGGDGGPPRPRTSPKPAPARPKEDLRVDVAKLYAGNGIRRVDLSEATRSHAFQALVNPMGGND